MLNNKSYRKTVLALILFTLLVIIPLYRYFALEEDKKSSGSLARIEGLLVKNLNVIKSINSEKLISQQQRNGRWRLYSPYQESVTAVLVLACNRPTVSRCLESILKYKPKEGFPVFVSQGCNDVETEQAIRTFDDQVIYIKKPNENVQVEDNMINYVNYYKISNHYKWALRHMFDVMLFEQLIIIEDDMEITPDFFSYFTGFLPLLRNDPSLLCVSSWNDNGKIGKVEDPSLFYRTEFFPGLGWMLTKDLWSELKDIWPKAFWDDWLRGDDVRKGRSCIRPEVSRSSNFGKNGVSAGLYFDEHIANIETVKEPVSYAVGDKIPNAVNIEIFSRKIYDNLLMKKTYMYSTEISSEALKQLLALDSEQLKQAHHYDQNENVIRALFSKEKLLDINSPFFCGKSCLRRFVIYYEQNAEWSEFVKEAATWNMMTDIRANLARTSYLGIVCWKEKLASPQSVMLKQEKEWTTLDGYEKFVSVCLAPKKNYK